MRILLAVLLALVGPIGQAGVWGIAKGGGADRSLATVDESGAAILTETDLDSGTEEIVFRSSAGALSIGQIALTNRTIRFSAETSGLLVRTAGEKSPFRLSGGRWTFDGLSFEGVGLPAKAHYYGGAIDCEGGSLIVTNCSFAHLGVRFNGGAISARQMTGDVSVIGSVFEDNCCGVLNGTGGAIYASGRENGPMVTLFLTDCRFTGNRAQNAGAVMTVTTTVDEEEPVRLVVRDSRFAQNAADCSGGAVYAQGKVSVIDSIFEENSAGVQGGAMCLGGSAGMSSTCSISAQSVFRGNRALSGTEWTCGGAIALWGEGSALEVDGRHVRFEANDAFSGTSGFGGAVYAASGTVSRISLAQFNGNAADTAGGAVCAWGGELCLSTCVFSNDTVRSASGYGGAVATDDARLCISNTTVRYANKTAIDACRSSVEIVNTVVVDNGDGSDIEVFGTGASLRMNYVAYGRAAVSEEVLATLVTNRCLKSLTSAIYRGTTLLLDTSFDNPVANEGLPQPAYDHRNVAYGWQGATGYSIGAFECPAPDDEPSVELIRTIWFHNRADGLYYPQVTLRFLGGDASRLSRVALACAGESHELPEGCLAKLRTATQKGQLFVFGVDDAHWVASSGSGENFGYIVGWTSAAEKEELMLFSVADAKRPAVTVVGANAPVTIRAEYAPVTLASAPRRLSAAALPLTVSVPARFEDFRIGESVSGQTTVPVNAAVHLYGCAVLGGDWRGLGEVVLDDEGRFTAFVPDDVRFFLLKAEVPR